jgi:hypothetical protein
MDVFQRNSTGTLVPFSEPSGPWNENHAKNGETNTAIALTAPTTSGMTLRLSPRVPRTGCEVGAGGAGRTGSGGGVGAVTFVRLPRQAPTRLRGRCGPGQPGRIQFR